MKLAEDPYGFDAHIGDTVEAIRRGWLAYYAVPMSGSAITAFRHHMIERVMSNGCVTWSLRKKIYRKIGKGIVQPAENLRNHRNSLSVRKALRRSKPR
jgi:ActR/RegA family two-component response regulator